MRRILLLITIAAALLQADCAGVTGSSTGNPGAPPPPPPTVTVSVLPLSATVRVGATQPFSATVTGASGSAVTWQVNGVTGGAAATGTINASGVYTAPASVPSPNSVTVQAVSVAQPGAPGHSPVTLWNPTPVLASVSPLSVTAGAISITAMGSNFVSGAQVELAGSPLTTTFVSSTQLRATGTAATAGTFGVTVVNPDPGSSASGAVNLQVNPSGGGNPPPSPPPPLACSVMQPGQGGSQGGFVPFPADNLWNQDISGAAVDPNSTALVSFIGNTIGLHPDFGAGEYNGSNIGIPYEVVDSTQGPVTINFTAYGDESDPGPMPIPLDAPIEGDPNPSGDQHVLILDNANCWLYELYSAQPSGSSWNAGSAAVWDLTADEQRPYTWTSADAAGLPIFPGLARYDEVAAGAINHALRFTLQNSRAAFTPPASHWAATSSNANAAPMGMRLRLKASFDISTFSAANQVILAAMKKYGLIMADNGSSMYISGAPDARWSNDDLHNLGSVTAADFEVVKMDSIYTSTNVPTGVAPAISSFTASSQSISAGTPVTLNWTVTGASYLIVSPDIGAARGSSVVVAPQQSTTYTLYATNAFGRTTATINITVH
jgi:IPT/TIG domain